MHINRFKSAEQLTDWRNGDALPGNRGMPAGMEVFGIDFIQRFLKNVLQAYEQRTESF